jgi:hypothetical protein
MTQHDLQGPKIDARYAGNGSCGRRRRVIPGGSRGESEGEIEFWEGDEATNLLLGDRAFRTRGERENGCETILVSYEVLVRTGKARLAGSRYATVKGSWLMPSPRRPLGGETALAGSTPEKASAGVMPWSPWCGRKSM